MRPGLHRLAGLIGFMLLAMPAPAEPAPETSRRFTPAELRADLATLYRDLQAAHYDLTALAPKADLDRAYRRALAGLTHPLTRFEAEIRFEQFAAHVRMGHTRVDFPYATWRQRLQDGAKTFPLAIRAIDDRAYVALNHSGIGAIAPGDEIVAINGQAMARRLATARSHVSAETRSMANSLLDYDFPAYLWLDLGDVETFDIVLRRADGTKMTLAVPARTSAEMAAFAKEQPATLSLEAPMRDARMLERRIAYLRPGPFYNAEAKTGADQWEVSGFRAFIDGAFQNFATAGARALIIDLRGNPGGDNLFSDVMVAWFADRPFRFFSQFRVRVSPQSTRANADRIAQDAAAAGPVSRQYAEMYKGAKDGDIVDFSLPLVPPRGGGRFAGKVFVLVDRQSYSNAVSVAALVQDYRFGTIIGEPTSDMATAHGAMERFTLPNTGIVVGYPKAFIVRPNGDRRARGVTPDIPIPTPIVQSPADPVLQRAIAIAGDTSPPR